MQALTVWEVLGAWERGLGQASVDRALTLFELTASGDTSRGELARLSIGRRDAGLLALREHVFGPHMTALADCPTCGTKLQLDFAVGDVLVDAPTVDDDIHSLHVDDCDATFRLPNSDDLAALSARSGATDGRLLLQRCLLTARRNGQDITVDDLPDTMTAAIARNMGELDAQADVQLALTCAECGERWDAPLDIASFLWSEVHAWVGRILGEVHTIARAYGWREADILGMSQWRRQAYLELIVR